MELPPIDVTSYSDVNPLLEDQTHHSEATPPRESVDSDRPPSPPLHAADIESRGSPSAKVPPQRVQRIYHRQMNGKKSLSFVLICTHVDNF